MVSSQNGERERINMALELTRTKSKTTIDVILFQMDISTVKADFVKDKP